jgi:glycosyltransferase involved in cell wall biosynthesis
VADPHEAVLREMAEHYRMPLRDMSQSRPQLGRPSRVASLAFSVSRIAKRRPERRLAVLDSTFPWRMSGFRYHEATAILQARPDTLFFSTYEMTDPFPALVHPLADFPEIAMREGVTDAYGVFLWFLAGLVGLGPSREGVVSHPMEGLDISSALASQRIRLHGSLLPGGGFVATEESYAWAGRVIERLDTTFSFSDDVLDRFPAVVRIPPAFTDTRFYAASSERWSEPNPLVCLFAADAPPRKGVDVAIEALSGLDDGFHLHVVGPHEHRRSQLSSATATFHGWLDPPLLRDLHKHTHVFLSPVSAERPGPSGSGEGMTDGFPTQAAVDAMSSGCLLVSANPHGDHRVFEPGVHYIECAADATTLRQTLRELAQDPRGMRRIAAAGAARARERMDVRLGVEAKLTRIGL